MRERNAGKRSHTFHDGCDDGVADEGRRGRLRHGGHSDQFVGLRSGAQSNRKLRRDAGGHGLRMPAGHGEGSSCQAPYRDRASTLPRIFGRHMGVETEIFESQIPASMISSTEIQLKGQDTGHLLQDVLSEIRNVRRDAGYPALDPPADQIIGTQAVFNQLQGKYKVLTSEFADLMLGYYGTPLGEKNAEVLAMASARANKPPISCRAADLLQPEWERRRSEAAALPGFGGTDEDVLTYAMFPKIAPQFFKTRMEGPKHIGNEPATVDSEQLDASRSRGTSTSPVTYVVTLNGKEHKVMVAPVK